MAISKLLKLAANEAHGALEVAKARVSHMSDNLNDIQLYLDENKDSLPCKGEVKPDELLRMIEDLLVSHGAAESALSKSFTWSKAIIAEE